MKPVNISLSLGIGDVFSIWSWHLNRSEDEPTAETEPDAEVEMNTDSDILYANTTQAPEQPGVQLGFRTG